MGNSSLEEQSQGNKTNLERLFPGDSEMARRMRAFDWSATPLGSPETWPQNLRIAVGICLTSRFPMHVWWGSDLTLFYNDGYISFLGRHKHPAVLGRSGREAWAELWPQIGPMINKVFTAGEANWSEDILMFFDRELAKEEVHVTFSFSPVYGEDDKVEGMFCACTETTEKIVGNRRLETLRKLGIQSAEAQSDEEACQETAAVLGDNPYDIPFAAVYLADETGETALLAATAGLPEGGWQPPPTASCIEEEGSPWPLAEVLRTRQAAEIADLAAVGLAFDDNAWPGQARRAMVLPIRAASHDKIAGLLLAGVNPRRPLDAGYHTFFDLVAGHIGTAIAEARAYEEEKKRAEALAELDRAKTAFFSNVSHEFRTPLTLMLGPLEDFLAKAGQNLSVPDREQLSLVHGNSLRLLKLVNTMLDFSRIEAGRVEASYEPTDLATYTAELASVFRSSVEKVGLDLIVDCPPLPELVYVDREMWEKIVLNLLSNAFKFTFAGAIVVSLRSLGDHVELAIKDTGTGIAPEEMPRLFERFHRIRGAKSRTHEGTGIGLALVQELAKLHGGMVTAASIPGKGTTFTVTIPTGFAHLPRERLGATRTLASTVTGATPFIEEALKWLPGEAAATQDNLTADAHAPESSSVLHPKERAKILLADDNADMRNYICRLLSGDYEVEAVADGSAALASIRKNPPDLVLTDIMMPGLDGIELLRELRIDPSTRAIPVILLSARAGEESRVDGLNQGADDYLIKPFSARELLAKIGAQLARVRREMLKRQQGEFTAVKLLYDLSTRLVGPDNIREISHEILEKAINLTGADMGTFQLFDAETNMLKITAQHGFRQPFLDFFADVHAGHGAACGTALEQRQRVIVEDVTTSPVFVGTPSLDIMLAAGVRSVQSTPLVSRTGELVGMLATHYREVRQADEIDLGFIDLLAGQSANIIEHVQALLSLRESEEKYRLLSEELRIHRDNLEKIVEERTTEILRLDRLNTVGEMAAAIGHEVRNPMTTVRGYLQMMQRKNEYAGYREQLKTMIEEIDRANIIICDFLSLAKNKAVEMRKNNLNDVVGTLLPLMQTEALRNGHELNTDLGDVPEFAMDEREIRQLLLNLTNNAFQAMQSGGKLTIVTNVTDGKVTLSVHDTGIGIPQNVLDKLGTPFLTTKENGTGLGLAVCYRIADHHGAKIDVKTSSEGTTFIISFPTEVQ